jgi:16S rRNA (uracil1498-N3)-methyltransferase
MIGPEGDFSKGEVSKALSQGFKEATLGEERLRTETAALAACHIVDLKNNI